MAKVSGKYEVMVVFSEKNGEESRNALVKKFKERIERHASAVEVNEEWGTRKLAYPINYETEGNYVLWDFTSECSFPAELERVFGITDGVLRFLIMKK
jgi:small subunit ribosomal protein S6